MTEEIHFYLVGEEHGYLSNFSAYPIFLSGKRWPTTEHYFQAQKFLDEKLQMQICHANGPRRAAEMGRDRKYPLRRDWESVKDDVMREAVRAKFTQHADLRELLLATDDARIVEHTAIDSYWADGGDGTGKNRLGLILMEVREELRQAAADSATSTSETRRHGG